MQLLDAFDALLQRARAVFEDAGDFALFGIEPAEHAVGEQGHAFAQRGERGLEFVRNIRDKITSHFFDSLKLSTVVDTQHHNVLAHPSCAGQHPDVFFAPAKNQLSLNLLRFAGGQYSLD